MNESVTLIVGMDGKGRDASGREWTPMAVAQPQTEGVIASSSATCSADLLANEIALKILTTGDGRICHRVQLKSGSWPHNEKSEGDLCQSALDGVISKQLIAAGYPLNVKLTDCEHENQKP